jgi:RNA polymerase sigma-70 factor (ECF subfamily)
MIDEYIGDVARTLRRRGVPRSDIDDEIQRTFIIVAGRLEDLEAGSERSFLYKVALNVASHARRKVARRREILERDPREQIDAASTPDLLVERKRLSALLDDTVGSLQEPMRVVFTLYEIDDMSTHEIAELLGVPRGTVASRLRRARKQLRAHVAALDLGDALPPEAEAEIAEPALLKRERVSALQSAMLAAGASVRASAATYAKTLAALGFTAPISLPSTRWKTPRDRARTPSRFRERRTFSSQ